MGDDCCSDLFAGFTFQNIRTASPPNRKGVYVIRVRRRGQSPDDVLQQAAYAVDRLNWPLVGRKMSNRTRRLREITECPVIYIGSAGTRATSRHTLKGRYADFAGRHTAMYPLWALLYCGWDLEYGWKEQEDPAALEASLKQAYKQRHRDALPALVSR
jgi:hypothetical protein